MGAKVIVLLTRGTSTLINPAQVVSVKILDDVDSIISISMSNGAQYAVYFKSRKDAENALNEFHYYARGFIFRGQRSATLTKEAR